MTFSAFLTAISESDTPPESLAAPLRVLWFTKTGQWEAAHDLASEIHNPMGSRLHGLLHTIEGDLGNAGYWYSRANSPSIQPTGIDAEWEAIARELTAEE